MRGVQKRRPSLFDLVDKMKTITAPTLIMTGDEDWPCLEPGILMKKNIPTAALVVMANAATTSIWRSRRCSICTCPICSRPRTPARGRRATRARWRAAFSGVEQTLGRVIAAVDQKVGAGHEA